MTNISPDESSKTTIHRIPLLKDQHTHPLFYAACMDGINIRNIESKQGAINAIEFKSTDESVDILIVQGWVDSKYELTPADLNSLGPVAVFNLSLHGLVLNAAASALLHEKYGSEVSNCSDPIWYEKNIRRVLNWFAGLNASVERLQRFYEWLRETHGVAYAEEMLLVDEAELGLFRDADLLDRTRFWAAPDTYEGLSDSAREMVHGLKLFTDGALGVRTAAVHTPYDNGDCGMLMYTKAELHTELQRCFASGKAMAIHAIGDRAIDQVVWGLTELRSQTQAAPEVRIEHAQLISEATARQAKDLGVKLCMQPNFSADSTSYSDRLAPHYLPANNPFRMLIDTIGFIPGDNLIFGSDGMLHGATEALQQSLFPPYPAEQTLTIKEFAAGYCLSDYSQGAILVKISGGRIIWETED